MPTITMYGKGITGENLIVRINGSTGPEYLNLPVGEDKAAATGAKAPKTEGKSVDKGHEHVSSQKNLIQEALASTEVNSKAVEEARKLIESGELDTPEAIERAARNMIDLGF